MSDDLVFWSFERDGQFYDHEFRTKDQAQEEADEGFEQECRDEGGWKNGETASAEIFLIQFKFDDAGERVELQRIKSTVDFEYYHGDLAEHGTVH